MKINWKLRFKNKAFWMAFVPALFLLIQTIGAVFGYSLDFSELTEKVLAVVCAVFSIYGIFLDPTTPGIKDSNRAMNRIDLKEEVDK